MDPPSDVRKQHCPGINERQHSSQQFFHQRSVTPEVNTHSGKTSQLIAQNRAGFSYCKRNEGLPGNNRTSEATAYKSDESHRIIHQCRFPISNAVLLLIALPDQDFYAVSAQLFPQENQIVPISGIFPGNMPTTSGCAP
jgi:hypothetical protein